MDLIDREKLAEKLTALDMPKGIEKGQYFIAMCNVIRTVFEEPAAEAVPLEPLCEWLSDNAGRPIDCNRKLCGQCEFDGVGVGQEKCWENLIRKWMEGRA